MDGAPLSRRYGFMPYMNSFSMAAERCSICDNSHIIYDYYHKNIYLYVKLLSRK